MRTLGLFLLAQAQGNGGTEAARHDLLQMVAGSSPVAKAVLLVLILFSITSWAIILFKLWVFSRSERHSAAFLDVFRRSSKFSEVQAVCKTLGESPLVGIFQAGYAELNAQLRQANPAPANPAPARPTIRSLAALDRALLRAAAVEVNKLEGRLQFLATTASITPYIGLFGTVWGIMAAFQGIGETGSSNLGVVAPHIAEALIATAAGLFAAIPAVYFYNHLSNRVKLLASEMDDFSLEFLTISERNFT
ncbi:MAG TPA: MotA/TolQ/ExbB proton channel family protein [Vicinamibacterales bacterium]|nr:MotA/TolQ/ExbB proton channel family protein [Vicinamibacterales bacterium]